MEKMTKTMWYDELVAIVNGSDYENKEEAVAFLEGQKALVEAKKVKAKERAAAKKAEGDELRGLVEGVLTSEFQSADALLLALNEVEDLTKAKVVARLTQLCKAGVAEKEQIKGEDGAKRMYYKLAE